MVIRLVEFPMEDDQVIRFFYVSPGVWHGQATLATAAQFMTVYGIALDY